MYYFYLATVNTINWNIYDNKTVHKENVNNKKDSRKNPISIKLIIEHIQQQFIIYAVQILRLTCRWYREIIGRRCFLTVFVPLSYLSTIFACKIQDELDFRLTSEFVMIFFFFLVLWFLFGLRRLFWWKSDFFCFYCFCCLRISVSWRNKYADK